MPGISDILQSGSLAYTRPSPASVAARRALALQLQQSGNVQNAGPFGVLANALGGSLAGYENRQATMAEDQGTEEARRALAEALKGGGSFESLSSVASDPWLSQSQSALVNTLLGKQIDKMYAEPKDPRLFQFNDRIVSIGPDGQPQELYTAPSTGTREAPTLTTIYDENGREQKGYMQQTENGPTFVPVGAPKATIERPEFTVSQATAAGYADRMAQADAVLSDPRLASVQTDLGEQRGNIPLVGNFIASPEFQQADQAQRDFINAILRRESGAVISDSEFANARKQYFPQPGDSPAVLQQKAANRKNAIIGVQRAAGPAYQPPDTTNYLTGNPAEGEAPSAGSVEDGYVFKGGDPADPNNWEKV